MLKARFPALDPGSKRIEEKESKSGGIYFVLLLSQSRRRYEADLTPLESSEVCIDV
jgi:hypothetical protein